MRGSNQPEYHPRPEKFLLSFHEERNRNQKKKKVILIARVFFSWEIKSQVSEELYKTESPPILQPTNNVNISEENLP